MVRFTHSFGLACLLLSVCSALSSNAASNPVDSDTSFEGVGAKGTDFVEHGRRLSAILNCQGCHGPDLQGRPFPSSWTEPSGIWASNITLSVPDMENSDLEALIRFGDHPENRELWFMPSSSFQHLSKSDMEALIGFLRTIKPGGEPTPDPVPTEFLLERMGRGNLLMTGEKIERHNTSPLPSYGEELSLGRYIVEATCTECHGGDLRGLPPFAPPMTVAGAYDDKAFLELLETGKAIGNRDIGVMGQVGSRQMSNLTPNERQNVVRYIRAWLEDETNP